MKRTSLTPERIEHDDCRRIATVLEGMAGWLRAGRELEESDLRDAAEAAEWIWQAGPKPLPAETKDFESQHAHLLRAAPRSARGAPKESATVEAAALRMGVLLRRMGHRATEQSARKELPEAVNERLETLARQFAAYAVHPAAA